MATARVANVWNFAKGEDLIVLISGILNSGTVDRASAYVGSNGAKFAQPDPRRLAGG